MTAAMEHHFDNHEYCNCHGVILEKAQPINQMMLFAESSGIFIPTLLQI